MHCVNRLLRSPPWILLQQVLLVTSCNRCIVFFVCTVLACAAWCCLLPHATSCSFPQCHQNRSIRNQPSWAKQDQQSHELAINKWWQHVVFSSRRLASPVHNVSNTPCDMHHILHSNQISQLLAQGSWQFCCVSQAAHLYDGTLFCAGRGDCDAELRLCYATCYTALHCIPLYCKILHCTAL